MEILLGCYRYKTTELQEYLLCVLGYVQHAEHFIGVNTTQYIWGSLLPLYPACGRKMQMAVQMRVAVWLLLTPLPNMVVALFAYRNLQSQTVYLIFDRFRAVERGSAPTNKPHKYQ